VEHSPAVWLSGRGDFTVCEVFGSRVARAACPCCPPFAAQTIGTTGNARRLTASLPPCPCLVVGASSEVCVGADAEVAPSSHFSGCPAPTAHPWSSWLPASPRGGKARCRWVLPVRGKPSRREQMSNKFPSPALGASVGQHSPLTHVWPLLSLGLVGPRLLLLTRGLLA